MVKRIFIIARRFNENSGSYAGFIEKFAKFASKKGYQTIILATRSGKEKEKENLGYAVVERITKLPDRHVFTMNWDYYLLGIDVKKYFKKVTLSEEDLMLVNGRAALGVTDKKYVLRFNQPAGIFLKNMEIADNEVSNISKLARKIHFGFIQPKLEKICVKNASGFIFPSAETGDLNLRYYKNKKPSFIPQSGVDFKSFSSIKKIRSNKRFILFVSAGEEKIRKGIVYLEQALPEILKEHKDVNLLHVGAKFNWNVPQEFKKRIVSNGIVEWNDIKNYYAKAEMMVITALNEGIPNTLIEGMASGVPVLSSDINGITEYITHLKGGYIYKRGDVAQLVKGINYLLNNEKKAMEMVKVSQEIVRKLDYDKFHSALLDFLIAVNEGKAKDVNLISSR